MTPRQHRAIHRQLRRPWLPPAETDAVERKIRRSLVTFAKQRRAQRESRMLDRDVELELT
jgi:hypothetical protein